MYHSAPLIAAVLFKATDFHITHGKDQLCEVANTPANKRFSCSKCRSPIFNSPQFVDLIAVFPNTLEKFEFKPQCHIWAGESVLQLSVLVDDLPRYLEWPDS